MDMVDSRTRSYVAQHRSSSGATRNDYAKGAPARIFEHRRLPIEYAMDRSKFSSSASKVKYPSSFAEIEQWLGNIVVEATVNPPQEVADPLGCIKLLFLDEKRCLEVFKHEFDLSKLHRCLKINDWSTAHYMSTYCRFATPLDIENDIHDNKTTSVDYWDWRFSISHPFDWDLLWAYFPATRTSVAIVRTWFEGYEAGFLDLEAMVTNFSGPTLAHPMLLGLFALQVLTRDAMANVHEKGNRIFAAQRRTGFHTYGHLRVTDLDVDGYARDLNLITKDVLSAASNMTGWENASRQLAGFASFLVLENTRCAATAGVLPVGHPTERLRAYIDQQSQKLISDLDGAYYDAKAWLATATFLMQGVLNLIAQRDANINIDLARDSKTIAEDARRDSTSMSAIAILTMFFLPATFTSAFFALPYFEETIAESGTTKFWIYWAVTIPLMVVVMGSWLLWTRFTNRRKSRLEHADKPLVSEA